MKRKELQTRRSLFVETPPPQKKKPRKLLPGLSAWKVPAVIEEEPAPGVKAPKLIMVSAFPSLQNQEDPIDAFLKEYDYFWKSFGWTQQEEQRKERLKELERYLEQKGLEGIVEYAESGGFLALKNKRVVDTLIELQKMEAIETDKEKRQQASEWIEKILNGLKKTVERGRRKELSQGELAERILKSNRASKQRYDASVCTHFKDLYKSFVNAAKNIPPRVRNNPVQFKKAVKDIASPLIAEALASDEGPQRKAGKLLQQNLARLGVSFK